MLVPSSSSQCSPQIYQAIITRKWNSQLLLVIYYSMTVGYKNPLWWHCRSPSSALITISAAAAIDFRRAIRFKIRKIKKWSITKHRIEVACQIIFNWTSKLARKYEHAWHSIIRQTIPRTEIQSSQRWKFSEFTRNGTREISISCSNIMARNGEQTWDSCQQDKPIHVQSQINFSKVSSPISLGMEPVI
jgi:hypothetical protein